MRKEVLQAPVSGIISQINVPSNSFVNEDELILSLEVMKLFYNISAGISGTLNLTVHTGEFVQESQILGEIIEG